MPLQNLAGIVSAYRYYQYSGDVNVLNLTYDMSLDYLKLFSINNGLIKHRKGSWDWADWGENTDIAVLENAWYYYALSTVKKSAIVLDNTSDLEFLNTRINSIYSSFNDVFWTNNGYTSNKSIDDRANALAVVSGLASNDKYNAIINVLTSVYNSSPYMEKIVLEAMCQMGYSKLALDRMLERYSDMISSEDSALWEFWNRNGSINHSWSGGSLIIMSKYLVGISPIDKGYDSYHFKPDISSLSEIDATVPTIKGNIAINITSEFITLRADFNAEIVITLPKSNSILINGVTVIDNNEYIVNDLIANWNENDKYYSFTLLNDSLDIEIYN